VFDIFLVYLPFEICAEISLDLSWCLCDCFCLSICSGPEQVVENIPEYPNFARDVFKVICDYFSNQSEPVFPVTLGPTVVNIISQSKYYV